MRAEQETDIEAAGGLAHRGIGNGVILGHNITSNVAAVESETKGRIVARKMEKGGLQGVGIEHLKIVIYHVGDIYEDLPQSAAGFLALSLRQAQRSVDTSVDSQIEFSARARYTYFIEA